MTADLRVKPPPKSTFIATALRRALTIPALFVPMTALAQVESGLEDIGAFGGTSSVANGVSADGSVVVGTITNADNSRQAYRWTSSGGLLDLGSFGGTTSIALGTSADGSVVVGYSTAAGNPSPIAFR